MKQIRTRRLMAATVIGTIATLTSVTGAYAEPVNPETLMAERTNPAVQLIETEFTATVSSRPITFNKNGSDLFYRAVYKWDIGELRSASDVVGYMFDRIASDPTYYLREVGEARTKTLRDIYSGSGFVASPDGYGHCEARSHLAG
jgi:serine protease Do